MAEKDRERDQREEDSSFTVALSKVSPAFCVAHVP